MAMLFMKIDIREGILQLLKTPPVGRPDGGVNLERLTELLVNYLHSEGVVIKVDRELPDCAWTDLILAPVYRKCRQDMVDAGFGVAVEPLIDKVKEGNE